jgi:PHS family inorganic phosphate transporter-like MFS transporter
MDQVFLFLTIQMLNQVLLTSKYGQFFLGGGPSVTTFLIPAEVFPTRLRATTHGISAAAGKFGALATIFAFSTITEVMGLPGSLGLLSGVLVCAGLLSFWIPEPKGKTLQDIESDSILYARIPAGSSENEPCSF